VSGFAVTLPGAGETSTEAPGSVALCTSFVGRHAGALAEDPAALELA
jgi:hypothetical protein